MFIVFLWKKRVLTFFIAPVNVTLPYNTVYLRALKRWRNGQPNLAHGTETKNKEKLQNNKPIPEQLCWQLTLSFEFDLLTVAVSMSTPALNRAAFIDTRRTFLSRFKGFLFFHVC